MKKNILKYVLCGGALLASVGFTACDDYMEGDGWRASTEPQLDEYMAGRSDCSLFLDIINQGDLRGMVHAYGTYTLFAPTNDAVIARFRASGIDDAKAKIRALSADSARAVVKYHMLSDTIRTSDFVNGTRLNKANMETDYLVTDYISGNDSNYYTVNRKARIITPDVHTGNGILHVINSMLYRPEYTVQTVFADINKYRDNADNGNGDNSYAIINRLMQSVLADSLKTTFAEFTKGYPQITLVVTSDSIMQANGITNMDELVEALQSKNISDYSTQTLLKNWVQYHILNGRYYQTDINNSTSLANLSDLKKVITVTRVGTTTYLNRFADFGEEGLVLRASGDMVDFTCSNGTLQTVDGELEIVERAAARINWDFADQPEMRALSNYRKAGCNAYFYSSTNEDGEIVTDLQMMSWSGKLNPSVHYECDFVPALNQLNFDGNSEYTYGDYLNFRLGQTTMQYMEIKTPTLVAGKYKVWIRFRRMGTFGVHGIQRMTFKQDGEEDQVFSTYCLSNGTEKSYSFDQDEADAAKGAYAACAYNTAVSTVIGAVLMGTIDVKSDGVHTLRLDPTENNQSLGQNYDMLYYIPIDVDQVNPRVMLDGNDAKVYKMVRDEDTGETYLDRSQSVVIAGFNADYRTHIFPYQCPVYDGTAGIGNCPYGFCINHDPSHFSPEGDLLDDYK